MGLRSVDFMDQFRSKHSVGFLAESCHNQGLGDLTDLPEGVPIYTKQDTKFCHTTQTDRLISWIRLYVKHKIRVTLKQTLSM
jgi:hypothetical protein